MWCCIVRWQFEGMYCLHSPTDRASHPGSVNLHYALWWRNSPWIGGLQHINKGLKLVPECITDSGLAFTCSSRDSSPTGVTHPSYCGTKEVLIMKEKAESKTKLHVIIPEKTGILMSQNERRNSSLLGCDSITWQTNLDVLKNHSARVLDPKDEGTTILQCWKQLTQWHSITSQRT